MTDDRSLRTHLRKVLDWEDAHVNFDTAVDGIGAEHRDAVPQGLPNSIWQLVEHLRRTQFDILDFCRNPDYVEPAMEDYWPPSGTSSTPETWNESLAAFRRDRDALKQIAEDPARNLFARIPHGSGQTYLREILLVADHNAYHVGQIVAVRRSLGIWR